MDRKKNNACFRCCRCCFIRHKNKNDGSSLSFFKIMFGQKFDEILVMPPMFAKKVNALVGKKITLEDSNERQWDVQMSDLKGSLAFKKGWRNFVVDHDIEMGDLLVFHYLRHEHFVVEIFGKTACPKISNVISMDKDRASETTRSYIPTKLSSDSDEEYEQQTRKRDRNYPSSKRVKEPTLMARVFPTPVHIRETSPTAVPLAETHVNPVTSREKDNPKLAPVVETQDPCLTTNLPKVGPGGNTLVEPCLMTCQDNVFIEVDDGDRLFDLSAFEMPDKKSATVMDKETQYRPDVRIFDSHDSETSANRTIELQNTVNGMADKKSVINQDVEDYLPDKSAFEMPEKDYLNPNAEGELHRNLQCQESGFFQNTEITAASIDPPKSKVTERCTKEVLSEPCGTELIRLECAPLSTSPPKADLPIDSIMPLQIIGKPETSQFSALSGVKMGSNNLETKAYDQEICGGKSGNADSGSPLGTKSYTGKLNSGDFDESLIHAANLIGGNMKRINQESRVVKQDIFSGDAMVSSCFDNIFSTSGDFAENFSPVVKQEPVDCCAPSATAVKVICSVPPDSENFLELPEPLPVAPKVYRNRNIKPQHQLVLLRDDGGRLWPVIYHHKNDLKVLTYGWTTFMKAYNIQPGDKCSFTLENSEESMFAVEIDRHE